MSVVTITQTAAQTAGNTFTVAGTWAATPAGQMTYQAGTGAVTNFPAGSALPATPAAVPWSFTHPSVAAAQTLALAITDGSGATASENVTISASTGPPPTFNALHVGDNASVIMTNGHALTITAAGIIQDNGIAIPGGDNSAACAFLAPTIWGEDQASSQWFTFTGTTWSGPNPQPGGLVFFVPGGPVITLTGITLSSTTVPAGSATATVVGTIGVTVSGTGNFTGQLTVSGTDASHFAIANGNQLVTAGVITTGTYAITLTARMDSASGSPFVQNFPITATGVTITGVSLGSSSFVGGAPAGTVVGTVTVNTTGGNFTGNNLALGGADAASFALSGTNPVNLITVGVLSARGYAITITPTMSGAAGSGTAFPETITGTAPVVVINGISLSNNSFAGGAASGTLVGNVTVNTTGGTFAGGAVTVTGPAAANFAIAGTNPITLVTSGTVSAGNYSINLVATLSGATGSPFTAPETITGTPAVIVINGITLSNSTFQGGAPTGTQVGTINVATTGGNFVATAPFTLGGANAASFAISGGNILVTNGVLPPGPYTITITATMAGATGSPFTSPPLTVTGSPVVQTVVITSVGISATTFPGNSPNGTVVGLLQVNTTGGNFNGNLALSGANAPNFAISGQNLVTLGVDQPGTYNVNVIPHMPGATGSDSAFPLPTITATGVVINGVTVGNLTFPGSSPSGTVVGAINVQTTGGTFAGGTLQVAGADAARFAISGSNLVTQGIVPAGTYNISIVPTLSGATNSGTAVPFTITGTTAVITITGIILSNSSFTGGAASGTVVGAIQVQATGGTFVGTGPNPLALSGTDAAKFSISGNNLITNGVVAAGTYAITITATQAGATGSPKAVAFPITGTSVVITGVTLSNSTFTGGAASHTTIGTILVATTGGGFNGTLALTFNALARGSANFVTMSNGNKLTLPASGNVTNNGTAIPGGDNTSHCAYFVATNLIWGQDTASGKWYNHPNSATGATWTLGPNNGAVPAGLIYDTDAAKFTILGPSLNVLATNGVDPAGPYTVLIVPTMSGATGSGTIFPVSVTGTTVSNPVSITGATVTPSTFVGGAAGGTVVGAVAVQTTGGTFAGTVALSGANSTSFALSSPTLPSNLLTVGVLPVGTYGINIVPTMSGATGSGSTFGQTITGTPPVVTITGISLTNSSFVGGSPSGTQVGTINVATTGGSFTGTNVTVGGTNAASFAISVSGTTINLVTVGVLNAGSYSITLTATMPGATGSPFTSAAIPITGSATPVVLNSISLSNASFVGGSPAGTLVGVVNVATTNGPFTGTNVTVGGTNAASFAISVSGTTINLRTVGVVATGSYSITLTATMPGATGSPLTSAPITITGQAPAAIIINAVNLSNASFVGGSPAGTIVGQVTVATTNGTFTIPPGTLSIGGTDAAKFALSGGNNPNLVTVGVLNAGTFSITLTATLSGATGSPFTSAAKTITASAPPVTLTAVNLSNSSFVSGSPAGTVVGNVTVATTGGSFTGTNVTVGGANAASFAISVSGTTIRLVTVGVLTGGPYSITLIATMPGATGSPLTSGVKTITATPGTVAFNALHAGDAASIAMSNGHALTITAAGVIQDNGVAIPGGDGSGACAYLVGTNTIYGQDSQTGSWFSWDGTTWNPTGTPAGLVFFSGTSGGPLTLTGITLSNSTINSGLPSGTPVGTITVQATGGTPIVQLSLGGANAASFRISGTSLLTNAALASGTYNINIIATMAGAVGSPFSQPETITVSATVTGTTFADEFTSLSIGNGQTWNIGAGGGPGGGTPYMENATWVASTAQAPEVYTISNGMLKMLLEVRSINGSQFAGGQISTTFTQTHGYFECRASVPLAPGTGFAFWLLPATPTSGAGGHVECDIAEIPCFVPGGNFDISQHLQSSIAGLDSTHGNYNTDATQFHTYGIDIESGTSTWYIDRVATFSRPTPSDWNQPFFMILEMTQGGDQWAGPVQTGSLPCFALVDYVRAWATRPF